MKKNRTNKKLHIRALTFVLMLVFVVVGFSATLHSEVEAASKKMKLSATSKKLDVGKSFTLKIYTRGDSVLDSKGRLAVMDDKDNIHYWFDYKTKATWKSSNPKVATVSSKGKVTAKKKGTATITAKVGKTTYKCKVTVLRPISKKLLKFEEIPTAGNGFGGAGLAYKITNNNDYTVEFSLWGRFYAMNKDKGYKYEWTKKEDCFMGTYVIAPGESVFTARDTPCDNFYKFDDGTLSKYPDEYYYDEDDGFDGDLFTKVEGRDWKTTQMTSVRARTYGKFYTEIDEFCKSKHTSEVRNIKINLSADGKKLSVTNKGKTAITNFSLLAIGLNSSKEIDRVIGLFTDDFGTKTIKPGKTYTITFGKKDINWNDYFGKTGRPDRLYIENANNVKISY
ncbi:MAG: Ig-like domain-containing protein [Lachnobacterium sp.]|nr:Ig-like domain-containing protein [Lachnobacterium sp.]MDY5461746.1 Ig-like domain-containing protein [Agathobacter sp.]